MDYTLESIHGGQPIAALWVGVHIKFLFCFSPLVCKEHQYDVVGDKIV